MRKIGYARVSSSHQSLDRQIAALRAERCDRIFREKASGKSVKGRPELEKAIDQLGPGDILILAEWDRCTRSMQDGVAIIERIHARGALVAGPGSRLSRPDQAHQPGHPGLPSALAQDERERIHRRASEGRKAAKARGAKFGRKPKLTEHQQAEARSAWRPGRPADRSPRPTASITARCRAWPSAISYVAGATSPLADHPRRRLVYPNPEMRRNLFLNARYSPLPIATLSNALRLKRRYRSKWFVGRIVQRAHASCQSL